MTNEIKDQIYKCDVCGKECQCDEIFKFYTFKQKEHHDLTTIGQLCSLINETNFYIFVNLCAECVNELREHLTERTKGSLNDNINRNIQMFLTEKGMDVYFPLVKRK